MADGGVIELVLDDAQIDVLQTVQEPADVSDPGAAWVDVQDETAGDVIDIVTPGPQGPRGPGADPAAVTAQVRDLVAGYLQDHPAQVHVFTDPVATWPLPHAFGRLPAVTLYSLTGRQIHTDVDADTTTASARFPFPVPGYAVLT